MIKDLPKGLLAAVAEINNKSRVAFAEEQRAIQEKMQAKQLAKMPMPAKPMSEPAAHKDAASMATKNIKEATKTHTVPKTPKEKSLAALAAPRDKITHADVMVGRGVKKEEAEQVDEAKAPSGSPFSKDYKPAEGKPGEKAGFTSKKISTGTVYSRKPAKDMKENTDTPGNSTHQCAIHVKSEQFGEGKTLFSQHAEPDADGNIAWYDIMFEHGIEKQVPVEQLEIVVSESHMNHKKKK